MLKALIKVAIVVIILVSVVFWPKAETLYVLSISQNGRVPSTYFIIDHKIYDQWLWYKETNGVETWINIHTREISIQTEIPK